jgi:mediator of RNA polymerase II transcription subunit 10
MERPKDLAKHPEQEDIERCLEEIIEDLRQLVIIVENFQSQELLDEKINTVINKYQQLEMKRHGYEIEIPLEIFEYIDAGQNPDLYLKKSLDECISKNERTKGKITTLQAFKEALEVEIEKAYPQELEMFRQFKPREK